MGCSLGCQFLPRSLSGSTRQEKITQTLFIIAEIKTRDLGNCLEKPLNIRVSRLLSAGLIDSGINNFHRVYFYHYYCYRLSSFGSALSVSSKTFSIIAGWPCFGCFAFERDVGLRFSSFFCNSVFSLRFILFTRSWHIIGLMIQTRRPC
jgi:hypothetical protein